MTFTPSFVVFDGVVKKEEEGNNNSLQSHFIMLKDKLAMEQQSSLNDGVRTKIFGIKIFYFEDLGSNAILLPHNPWLYDDRQQDGELNHKHHTVEMLESYS